MSVAQVFKCCVEAINRKVLIRRVSRQDKEFHFQNWFKSRLQKTTFLFESGGRNSYPDFSLVEVTDGYELKGLAYPGRDATYDANSQVPTGSHNGRSIYYVFGRYPKKPDGDTYPVLDLVVCHGDFLNANHNYVHKNRNVKGFGSYGDIMIRDRKMYVVPTPFRLIEGSAHHQTLVLPDKFVPGDDFFEVGALVRTEASDLIVGYSFNLQANKIMAETIPNPHAGRQHHFRAWRLVGSATTPVKMRLVNGEELESEETDGEESE
ncbi:MAG: hypothetical protein IT427_06990 [Pirellulales bacterium]|nr:hypothetical protein [Pirellulales bacterium]